MLTTQILQCVADLAQVVAAQIRVVRLQPTMRDAQYLQHWVIWVGRCKLPHLIEGEESVIGQALPWCQHATFLGKADEIA